jgi:predicted TIM-barrel fold metal-dependent hydrolase
MLQNLNSLLPGSVSRGDLFRISYPIRFLLVLSSCFSIAWCQDLPPRLIDCHVHHNGSKDFLEKLVAKLEPLQGMALLITMPQDLDQVTTFMKNHPGRLIGLGQIDLDAPDALQTVDRFHNAGFRGLGELTKPQYSYDDRRYWPIYERAEKYRMIILFHTGIVNRTHPEMPADASSDRMRVSTLDLIARRFPQLNIIGAHLGNPDYAWAAEIGRWNPNVHFDVSGSTLIKKQEDFTFFNSVFWWTSVKSAHTPQTNASAFEKLVFGSDVFEGDLDELDRELDRYRHMLDACHVSPQTQEKIFSGTLWSMLNR